MYLWIVITGGVFSFVAAMGIGANDAANSFATSVGSKTLTLKQAVGLACIFETGGAVLMGSHVSETIRKGIADYQCFEDDPDQLMYGCMWVVFSVGAWLFLASYLEMPVSTTHSCVGGMIGMAWSLKGYNCIKWYEYSETFPYIGGVAGIVLSWFISPIFSSFLSMFLFSIIRQFILRPSFYTKRVYFIYPILVGSTITLNTFFIIYKGAKGISLDNLRLEHSMAIAFGTGGVASIIVLPFLPKLYKYVVKKYSSPINVTNTNDIEIEIDTINNIEIDNDREKRKIIHIHDNAEKFDKETEEFFKFIQIFSAISCAFSHGANDVANAIGPFAALYTIYKTQDVSEDSVMENNAYWILGYGGVGISIGLVVYGYKIINAMGTKLCKITPSRGSIIEISSATIIIIGSRLQIPLSTTHCQIGATIGIGLLENTNKNSLSSWKDMKGINGKLLIKICLGWIATCFIVGITTGILTAQGIYSH